MQDKFKESIACANNCNTMGTETIRKNEASSKSLMSRGNIFGKIAVVVLFAILSYGCSQRLVDFTIISSKNYDLKIDKTKGIPTKGESIGFMGIGVSIKDAMDKALENAGIEYDLLIDGVVSQENYFFVIGFSVKGIAISSKQMIAELGDEGYQEWLKSQNILKPDQAMVTAKK